MSEQPPNGVFRFAAFQADLRRGELRKHGLRIKLQDQPFKFLAALLEDPGEVVSRDELRERIWGTDTFVDFNRGLSSAVNRLRDALGDSADNPRYIETVARKGYRFIAPLEVPAEPAPPHEPPRRPWLRPAAALATVACAAALAFWLVRRPTPPPPPRLDQITSFIGSETMPSFSPDGRQLAFVWTGEREDNAEIYVKAIDNPAAQRLTNHPGADLFPSWSPDGSLIAFFRIDGVTTLSLISPFGGPERTLLSLPGRDGRPPGPETRIVGDLLYPIVNRPSWTPDGRFLVIARYGEPPVPGDGTVLLVPVDGGEPRPLLIPGVGAWYKHPTLSADGRKLAVIACATRKGSQENCALQVFALSPKWQPLGQPHTILADAAELRGIAWSPDAESLVVAGFHLPRFYSWRVTARPGAKPERVEMAGIDAIWPTVHSSGRLAFARSVLQADLWRHRLGSKPVPFLSSTARDTYPQLSPDGLRVAFQSARGGTNDIWVARTDGTSPLQITSHFNVSNGSPAWSPDGRWLAFDSVHARSGNDVWVVESTGGQPRRLTQQPGPNSSPSWSRDGKFIYFTSRNTGRFEVWRIPAAGGAPVQVASHGGFLAMESPDGKVLFYIKSNVGTEGLFALPLSAGPERQITPENIVRNCFWPVPGGVYYITPRDLEWCDLRLHDLATGKSRAVAPVQRPVAFRLSATPDQKTFVYSRPVTGADLMLIDNFR